NAIQPEELEWPRSVREVFATVYKEHKQTNVPGRGTEEMKTNDVTGRFRPGEVGFSVDMGRPGVGVDLKDVEKLTMALAKVGVEFEPLNPLTFLMSDKKTGKLRDDVLSERVHSCIPEFKIKEEKFPEVLETLQRVSKEINSVFSLGICVKVNPDGSVPIMKYLNEHNIYYLPNGKTNIGIGKPAAKF
ncbi:4Fe-4S ferredoxin, partial [Candidatus Bathyarchaeota archaeon]|nr:4Fe-4S ferredoxin [Candidatus Bathyarchaeota archaeon]